VVRDDAVMPDLQREWRLPGESVGTVPVNPDAPSGARSMPRALALIWSDGRLRASVFGYFGRMS
jgi:hypothetical protein